MLKQLRRSVRKGLERIGARLGFFVVGHVVHLDFLPKTSHVPIPTPIAKAISAQGGETLGTTLGTMSLATSGLRGSYGIQGRLAALLMRHLSAPTRSEAVVGIAQPNQRGE